MGFGGSVWHASAAPLRRNLPTTEDALHAAAERALSGVGDRDAGEWVEYTGYAFHIRRRLTVTEERRIGPLVDVRGTPEAMRRLRAVLGFLPGYMHADILAEAAEKAVTP